MITIDAQGKTLGRVATVAAMALMGKHKPGYRPENISGEEVEVINASKIKFSGNKVDQKIYKSYSGYPGGLKETKMKIILGQKGNTFVIEKAIRGMIPRNRLQKDRMKMLKITE